MTTQPTALRLADALEMSRNRFRREAAAELRRLHASCEDYAQHKQRQDQRILALCAQSDALLAALRKHVYLHDKDCVCEDCAAIKAVEGETK